ncbi:MAG: hypothetical protein M3151_02985 [Actinomycetota bacterium]|nr:hypothetical protein [Actinomycetota bacterium]
MSVRSMARLAPLAFVAALALSAAALFVVPLNGGEIGSSDTTGSVILALSFSAIGAVIVFRRPENAVGWILLFGGLCNSLNGFSWEYSRYALLTAAGPWPLGPFFAWLSVWIFAPGFVASFPLTLLLFPTGRLPSPRWRHLLWLIAGGLALAVVPMAAAAWPIRGPALVTGNVWTNGAVGSLAVAPQRLGVVVIILCILASVVSIVLRFRSAAGEERQQLKWLVYAGALTFGLTVTASPAVPFEWPEPFSSLLSFLATLLLPSIPVAVGIAILRHRLYDIDFLINRTLVYGSLTAVLALVYAGGVVLSQSVLRALTGQGSTFAVVVSTLVIAGLFSPLRRRIQAFIDRRFYRKKYDAKATLEDFSARLRDETDLDRLGGELVSVVRETVQPAHASLWLRPARTEEARGRVQETRG